MDVYKRNGQMYLLIQRMLDEQQKLVLLGLTITNGHDCIKQSAVSQAIDSCNTLITQLVDLIGHLKAIEPV